MQYAQAKKFILDKLKTELDPIYTYHSLFHTKDVLKVASDLCEAEDVSAYDTKLVKTAALFHDAGFLISNQNHEELGCDIVREHLPNFGYTPEDIEAICGMIMATRIPQTPKTHLEEIIADADLDYLGREDFYTIGETLYAEFIHFGIVKDDESWNKLQIGFLTAHSFFTATNKANRAPIKQQYLEKLKQSS